MNTEKIRASFWWLGFALIVAGANAQWDWPVALIATGISFAAYAALNRGRPQ
jgi:hypothetical protein